jgi:hypothetical protein
LKDDPALPNPFTLLVKDVPPQFFVRRQVCKGHYDFGERGNRGMGTSEGKISGEKALSYDFFFLRGGGGGKN